MDIFRRLAGPYRVRMWLVFLVLAAAVPLVVFSGILFFRQLSSDHAGAERQILDRTKLLADDIDRELARIIAVAQILAASERLDVDDLAGFSQQAERVRDVIDTNVVLRDLYGQQLVNTRYPWGEPLPQNPIFEIDRVAMVSGQPQVSNLLTAGIAQAIPVAVVVVPVI